MKASRNVRGSVIFLVASFERDAAPSVNNWHAYYNLTGGEGGFPVALAVAESSPKKGVRRYRFPKGENCRHGDESSLG